ncbi:MAG: hypothetical protein ACE5GW_09855 [Planctomycetota bacterium]
MVSGRHVERMRLLERLRFLETHLQGAVEPLRRWLGQDLREYWSSHGGGPFPEELLEPLNRGERWWSEGEAEPQTAVDGDLAHVLAIPVVKETVRQIEERLHALPGRTAQAYSPSATVHHGVSLAFAVAEFSRRLVELRQLHARIDELG